MDWRDNRATTCVADVGISCNVDYSAMYVIMPLDTLDLSRCVIKRKKIDRHETPPGYVVYAGWRDYKRGVPHRFTTSRNFCNATNLSISLGEGRYASVSVYTNKLHICGCKSETEIRQLLDHLMQRLYKMQELLEYVKEHKEELMNFCRTNFTGIKCEVPELGTLHRLEYDALQLYEKYGSVTYILDPYLSSASYIEEVMFFLDWCSFVDIIDGKKTCKITYIDYHNIQYDLNLGFKVDLAALAYMLQAKNYIVEYSNVNDAYVHVVIPFEELDESVTKRKKSRYVINVYRTGAVKIYGPSFKGIQKEYDNFYLFVKDNRGLLGA